MRMGFLGGNMENISETTSSNKAYFQKLSAIQTCPVTFRLGSIKSCRFVRSPNLGKPEFPPKRKKCSTPSGAAYTGVQPDIPMATTEIPQVLARLELGRCSNPRYGGALSDVRLGFPLLCKFVSL